jgi:sugar lactone lactonase YvrE
MNKLLNKTGRRYFFYLFLFVPNLISGQNYTVKTFTTENGLANIDVNVIAIDSTGFLWIGTRDGLSRFDGYEFKNYYHIPGDTTSLSFYSIFNLVVDKANNLWILTENSKILLFDRINDNFKSLTNFGESENDQVYNLNVDKNGDLWIICNNELIRRNIISGEFIKFKIYDKDGKPYSLDTFKEFGLFFSGSDKIWLSGPKVYELEVQSSRDGTGKLIINNIYALESTVFQNKRDFDHLFRFSFYESPIGNRWIFSNIGLFKLDKDKAKFYEYKGKINNDEFTGDKVFNWAWSDDCLYSYDPLTHTTRSFKSETSHIVKAILQQGRNLIWFSSTSNSGNPLGLTRIVFTNSFFKNYIFEREGNDLPAVFSITKDNKNNIWAGVRGKDHIIQFTPDNKISKTGQLTPELFKLSGHIRSMIRVKNGIWIGYFTNLLMFYDFESSSFVRHYANGNVFRTLAASREENLFIGIYSLSLYYPESGETVLLWESPKTAQLLKLFLNNDGILWGGTSAGWLLKYNIITKESSVLSILKDNFHILDICPGDNNDLWLATMGEGVCNFNPETGKMVYYTTSSGLSNNTTYSILKDKSGNIWISTNKGISRLNPNTGYLRVFNSSDGLRISEFNANASYVADDGEFFFGGMGGFVGFYPDSLSESVEYSEEPEILLTDFSVSGEKRILQQSLNNSDTIILQKGENNFQLSFSSTDFINSEKTIFRYKLDGLNKNWIETNSSNRNVNYSALKPGCYILNIQTTNQNGEWTAEKRITFLVTPYFYQTRFFRISAPLVFFILVTGIIVVYIRQLKQSERQKQDALRLQSLRGQMNPHFIFNSLNSINYFISNNDKISANSYIADFSRLIRSILTNLGNDYVPFEFELNSIKDYLKIEHLRFGDKFDYELYADEDVIKSNLYISPGLVQPFIENSIWHGVRALEKRKGFIKVKFSPSGKDMIKCIVEDDGIGRKASMRSCTGKRIHKSKGIGIITERLQLISKLYKIGYNLTIIDLYPEREETGTRAEIDIPVKIS